MARDESDRPSSPMAKKRRKAIAKARGTLTAVLPAARTQDFLYDEYGLPGPSGDVEGTEPRASIVTDRYAILNDEDLKAFKEGMTDSAPTAALVAAIAKANSILRYPMTIDGLEANLLLHLLDRYLIDMATDAASVIPGYADPAALAGLRDRLFRARRHSDEPNDAIGEAGGSKAQ